MKKNLKCSRLFFIVVFALTTPACSSISVKLADMQVQKKTLTNGTTVYVNYNVPPTANWHCTEVASQQKYDWSQLKMAGAFSLKNDRMQLMDKALAYANAEQLSSVNYINLTIPDSDTVTTGSKTFTISTDYGSNIAYAGYYQCQLINPDHKLSMRTETDTSIISG